MTVLLLELLEAIGLLTPTMERFVSDVGDDTDDGSKKTPYRTIAKALGDQVAGQPLVIHLSGTLTESVSLPSGVTLVGPATLKASVAGPAVTVAATGAGRATDVVLKDLTLQGLGPYTGDGGAVLVNGADRVTVEGCELANSVADRGGGIAVLSFTGFAITRCRIHDNTAGTAAGLGKAGVTVALPPAITMPPGNGHGGGVFVRDSDGAITGCDVFENAALLFGGGIAVSHGARLSAPVAITDCEVTRNQVAHPPLGTLGTATSIARADIGDPVAAAFSGLPATAGMIAQLVALLHGLNFESGLGGGVAVRAANSVRISRCHIGVTRAGAEGGNRARHGGGVAVYIAGYPTIEDCTIAYNQSGGDGGGIAIDQFDPLLPPGSTGEFGVTPMVMSARRTISLDRNDVRDNRSLEDGGGVYATGNVQLVMKGGSVRSNRTAEDGGGIRVTYASNLYAEGVTIADNECNVDASGADGGGGVSARNAIVTLKSCTLTGNKANSFAGGAVYFVACWEGGIEGTVIPSRVANKQSTFDAIMGAAAPGGFAFHTRVLRLVDCVGSGNVATGASGAGGFLYAVRSADPAAAGGILGGGEPMWVDIEGPRTSVDASTSEATNAGNRKRGTIVVELSGTTFAAGVPQDRAWIGDDIPAGAIAPSIPTDVPAKARAAVITVDRDPTHDLERPAWTGAAFSFGTVPTITSVAPAAASTAGGTVLTITGTNFEAGVAVTVGRAAAAITARTATSLTVTCPAGPPGAADVIVTSASGARAVAAGAVTLAAP